MTPAIHQLGRRVHTVVDSPVGPLTLVAVGATLTRLHMDGQRHRPADSVFGEPDPAPFAAVIEQLADYFAGRRRGFVLPMDPAGTPFQHAVWSALGEIPYGETVSYRDLAARVGRPAAVRAVGLANGRNPIGIIVPCHRVIGADGSLTGYGGGLARKRGLLEFEARNVASAQPVAMATLESAARPRGLAATAGGRDRVPAVPALGVQQTFC